MRGIDKMGSNEMLGLKIRVGTEKLQKCKVARLERIESFRFCWNLMRAGSRMGREEKVREKEEREEEKEEDWEEVHKDEEASH